MPGCTEVGVKVGNGTVTPPTGRQIGSVAGWWAGCENRSRWILGTACQCEALGLALVKVVSTAQTCHQIVGDKKV